MKIVALDFIAKVWQYGIIVMKTTVHFNKELHEWLRQESFESRKSIGEIVRQGLEMYRNSLSKNEAMLLGGLVPQLGSLHKLRQDAIKDIVSREIIEELGIDPAVLMQKIYTLSKDLKARKIEQDDFELNDELGIRIDGISEVKRGSEFWRIDVDFIEIKTGYRMRVDTYEIWASAEFIEDYLHLSHPPSLPDLKEFAYKLLSKRYEELGEIPGEYGSFCTNKMGIKYVGESGRLLSYFNEMSK